MQDGVCDVGISTLQTVKVKTLDDRRRAVDVNVTSNCVTAHAALPEMLERGRGTFVLVTSLAAQGWKELVAGSDWPSGS